MQHQQQPAQQSSSHLLDLPDECLAQVFAWLAGDARSCCSAARAHSRLRQAAAAALSSIKVGLMMEPEHLEGLMAYLQHGQHIVNLDVAGYDYDIALHGATLFPHVMLHGLPSCPQLQQLTLARVHVQLGIAGATSSSSNVGVLHGLSRLTHLHLEDCILVNHTGHVFSTFAAAFSTKLTGLRHLHLCGEGDERARMFWDWSSSSVLPALAQLTYLAVDGGETCTRGRIQDPHSLSQLRELRISSFVEHIIPGTFAGLEHLTLLRLDMSRAPVANGCTWRSKPWKTWRATCNTYSCTM